MEKHLCKCGHGKTAHILHVNGGRGRCQDCDCCFNYRTNDLYEEVDHPKHYGGKDDPYEHIKVCEAKGWGYHIGNATKYLWRMGQKPGTSEIKDLKKAIWLLNRLLEKLEGDANAGNGNSTSS